MKATLFTTSVLLHQIKTYRSRIESIYQFISMVNDEPKRKLLQYQLQKNCIILQKLMSEKRRRVN